jgi:hypothetical protein
MMKPGRIRARRVAVLTFRATGRRAALPVSAIAATRP